ncbi:MAG: glycosyltransferase [Candidatus Gribaldobacteria bacterium]|nr:glycosyltransferase [Candidatus Gribaldobacteria bacterium]
MGKIKLTNLNPTDTKGGASLAGYHLHKVLLGDSEIDSVLLVDEKYTQDREVIKFSNFFLRQVERVLNKLGYLTGLLYLMSVNWWPLLWNKRVKETDIFLIRNLHGGLLPFWLPKWLSKKAPVIWRLPDMWPLTGHCCYAYSCEKWKKECWRCPLLSDYPAILFDTTKTLFRWKKACYAKTNLYLVVPSKWMFENLQQSPILNQFPRFLIPIGVDAEKFQPQVKNDKLTLLVISGSLKDKRKGALLWPSILKKLDKALGEKALSVDIWWAGTKDLEIGKFSNINNIFLGHLKEDQMPQYYAKAHLHILPTLADNLPNTILESLACETPVVVFDVGGCSDAVLHLKTGYLVDPFEVDDFVRGIMYFLEDSGRIAECGTAGRALVQQNFTMERQAELYKKLIQDIYLKKI